jgi:hypothetical protein
MEIHYLCLLWCTYVFQNTSYNKLFILPTKDLLSKENLAEKWIPKQIWFHC